MQPAQGKEWTARTQQLDAVERWYRHGCLTRRLVFMEVNAYGGCDSGETSLALERYNVGG